MSTSPKQEENKTKSTPNMQNNNNSTQQQQHQSLGNTPLSVRKNLIGRFNPSHTNNSKSPSNRSDTSQASKRKFNLNLISSNDSVSSNNSSSLSPVKKTTITKNMNDVKTVKSMSSISKIKPVMQMIKEEDVEDRYFGLTVKQIGGIFGIIIIGSLLVEQFGEIYSGMIVICGMVWFQTWKTNKSKKNKNIISDFSTNNSGLIQVNVTEPENITSNKNISMPIDDVANYSPPNYQGRRSRGSTPKNTTNQRTFSKSTERSHNSNNTNQTNFTNTNSNLTSPSDQDNSSIRSHSRLSTPNRSNRSASANSSAYQARVNASLAGKEFVSKSDCGDSDNEEDASSNIQRVRENVLGDCLEDFLDRQDPFGTVKFEKKPILLSDIDKADRLIKALDGDNLNRFCVLVASDADLSLTKGNNSDGNNSEFNMSKSPVSQRDNGYPMSQRDGSVTSQQSGKHSHIWSCSPASLRNHLGAGTAFSFTPRSRLNSNLSSCGSLNNYEVCTPRDGSVKNQHRVVGHSPMRGASPSVRMTNNDENAVTEDNLNEHNDNDEDFDAELTVMDSSYLNASLTNVMNMQELDQFIIEKVDEMDSVSLALAFSRGARFDDSLNVIQKPGMKLLLNKIKSSLEDTNLVNISGAMCNILWNMTKLRTRHADKGSKNSQILLDLATLMVDVATVNLWVFTQRELTNFMWSLSALAQNHNNNVRLNIDQDKILFFRGLPPKFRQSVTRLFLTFCTLYKDLAETFKGQEISNLAVAFCRASPANTENQPVFLPLREMVTSMAHQCTIRVRELQCQHVANTTWAFVKLGLSQPKTLGEYLEAVCVMLREDNAVLFMKPQECANIIWALARAKGKMGITVDTIPETFKIVDKVLMEVEFNHFVPQDYANLIWSHACLDVLDEEFFLSAFENSKKIFETFRSQELSNFLWGFSKTGVAKNCHKELYQMVKKILLSVPLDKHSNQSLVNICYSGVRMDQFEPDVFGLVAERLAVQMNASKGNNSKSRSILTTQEISNMAWVLAKIPDEMLMQKVKKQAGDFMVCVSKLISTSHTMRSYSMQELGNVLWAIARTGVQQQCIQIYNDAYNIIASRRNNFRSEEKNQVEWAFGTVGMYPFTDSNNHNNYNQQYYNGNGYNSNSNYHRHNIEGPHTHRPPRAPKQPFPKPTQINRERRPSSHLDTGGHGLSPAVFPPSKSKGKGGGKNNNSNTITQKNNNTVLQHVTNAQSPFGTPGGRLSGVQREKQ